METKKTFELAYTITQGSSYRSKDGIDIKSNLADDELIDCLIAKSLVEQLKTESAIFDPDKLILSIAEAQKRQIQLSLEEMDDMAIQAKVHSDKAHENLINIEKDSEKKYLELEKKFSETEARFNEKMSSTTEKIKEDLEKLTAIEEKLNKINNWSLEKLIEALSQLIKLAESDSELIKLVLNHKNKTI